MRKEDIIGFLIIGTIGFFLFYMGISSWKTKLSCKEKIIGTFLKRSADHSFGITKVYLVFEYQYAGKKFETSAIENNLSKRRYKEFIPGETYPLYINPHRPKTLRCTKKILDVNDSFMVFFGGFMFFGAILLFLKNLFFYF